MRFGKYALFQSCITRTKWRTACVRNVKSTTPSSSQHTRPDSRAVQLVVIVQRHGQSYDMLHANGVCPGSVQPNQNKSWPHHTYRISYEFTPLLNTSPQPNYCRSLLLLVQHSSAGHRPSPYYVRPVHRERECKCERIRQRPHPNNHNHRLPRQRKDYIDVYPPYLLL